MSILALLLAIQAQAAYQADRDPPAPVAKKQYRLTLHTPGKACHSWHKVEPQLPKEDLIVSATKKDEGDANCRFLWIISPASTPGPVTFSLDPITGPKETFELAAPANYVAPKTEDFSNSPFMHIPGIADENGTGPAMQPPKGKVSIPTPGTGR